MMIVYDIINYGIIYVKFVNAINNNGIKKKPKRDKKTNNDECYSRNASCAQN
jgi:hypothetical protein